MKLFILCVATCVLLISCSKSGETNDIITPDPVPDPVVGDSLITKMILQNHGFPADTLLYTYDANDRLIKEEGRGDFYGYNKAVTIINRDNTGDITSFSKNYSNNGNTSNKTVAGVAHIAGAGKYQSCVAVFKLNGTITEIDSTLYTYTGNNVTKCITYRKYPGETGFTKRDSLLLSYSNYPGISVMNKSMRWTYNFGWGNLKTLEITPDLTKKNPMYAPEVGLLVEFLIDEVEDDNIEWRDISLNQAVIKQTVYNGMYGHFEYTYTNNRPLTRSYNDFGPVNTINYYY